MQGHSKHFFSHFLSRTVASARCWGQQSPPDRCPRAPKLAAAPQQELPGLCCAPRLLSGRSFSQEPAQQLWEPRSAPVSITLSGNEQHQQLVCCRKQPPCVQTPALMCNPFVCTPWFLWFEKKWLFLTHLWFPGHSDNSAALTLSPVSSKLKRSCLFKFSLEGSCS